MPLKPIQTVIVEVRTQREALVDSFKRYASGKWMELILAEYPPEKGFAITIRSA